MNWLDIVIIAAWALGLFIGWRMGLFGAIFTTGGLIAGVLLAARFSDNVAGLLTDSISSDTLVTVISYAIIIVLVFIAAQLLKAMVKGIFKLVLLGWVDSLGGLALGLVAGVALSGAIIMGLARYSSDLPVELLEELTGASYLDIPIERTGIQEKLNTALVESTLVPVFLDVRDALPGEATGLVPDDFRLALDVLEAQIAGAEERK
ncbi:MAG: Colicin production protein [Dehalococcoidia bacterium]|nr:Colicin production protein [Dehalococcoidia bacterium]